MPPSPQGVPRTVVTLHMRLVVLSDDFFGNHDDFYEALEAQPDVLSGRFTYQGHRVPVRRAFPVAMRQL